MTGEPGTFAFIDMEFGHVHGTRSAVVLPVEAGALIWRPDGDDLCWAAHCTRPDLEVELWANIVDARGFTTGTAATVVNPARGGGHRPFDPGYRLPDAGRRPARREAARAYAETGRFLRELLTGERVSTLAFYAARREQDAFHRAGIAIRPYRRRDLQQEIRRLLGMDRLLSLDRAAGIIGFAAAGASVESRHFGYPVPPQFAAQIRPHRALGDAARIFLLFREYSDHGEEFVAAAGNRPAAATPAAGSPDRYNGCERP
jgi:hypothetical protein